MRIQQETVNGEVEYILQWEPYGMVERRARGCLTEEEFVCEIADAIFDYLDIEEKLRCTTAD